MSCCSINSVISQSGSSNLPTLLVTMLQCEQELRAFLTVEGSLADSYQWRQLQPLQGSVLEGIARLPKQLLGARLRCPLSHDPCVAT